MALRMMLTAMVVSMTLPLPSIDSCRSLVEEMNRELAAAFQDAGNEIAARFPKDISIQGLTNEAQTAGDLSVTSIDAAFANILDDFANEAALPSIEQAAIDARRIPVEPVQHPLPPATEALELLPSAAELIRSVSEDVVVRPVDSAREEWLNVVADRCTESETILEAVEMVRPVVSTDIGPWEWLDDRFAESEPFVEAFAPKTSETAAFPVDSMTSDWAAVLDHRSVEDMAGEFEAFAGISNTTDPKTTAGKESTIRDAFRKTAEAIALWSKVMARPF